MVRVYIKPLLHIYINMRNQIMQYYVPTYHIISIIFNDRFLVSLIIFLKCNCIS